MIVFKFRRDNNVHLNAYFLSGWELWVVGNMMTLPNNRSLWSRCLSMTLYHKFFLGVGVAVTAFFVYNICIFHYTFWSKSGTLDNIDNIFVYIVLFLYPISCITKVIMRAVTAFVWYNICAFTTVFLVPSNCLFTQ